MPQDRGGDVRWWCRVGFVEGHQLPPWVERALPIYFGASAPTPMSLLPLQVPLERHDGGIRLGDNQVSSVWSERCGEPFRAG